MVRWHRMRALRALLLVGLLCVLLPATQPLALAPRRLVATVERLADGDTLVAVTANRTKLRIRLLGIDAPEIGHGSKPGQPFGAEAQQFLDQLIRGRQVGVEVFGPDRYHRLLAVVWDGPVNVNVLLVAKGYAEVYRGTKCQAYCLDLERAEARARRDGRGIWSQERHESPQDFRRRMRLRG